MKHETRHNGQLEVHVISTNSIDQAVIAEFDKASKRSHPPKVKVESSPDGSNRLIVWIDKPSLESGGSEQ